MKISAERPELLQQIPDITLTLTVEKYALAIS
jgi:hypothetical protein